MKKRIPNTFNDFYVEPSLADAIPTSYSHSNFKIGDQEQSAFCLPFSIQEVHDAILLLKNSLSSGPDGLSNLIIKECAFIIAPVFYLIYEKHSTPLITVV